jgi:hypothetical protein
MNLTDPVFIKASPDTIFKRLLVCIVILLASSLFFQSLKFVFQLHFTALNFLVYLFNVDQERNIPTFFSVLILLYATWLLYSISVVKSFLNDKYRFHWWLLTIVLFLIAADEFMATHELISETLRDKYHWSGLLYYSWVVPFLVLVIALFIFYSGFLFKNLPSNTRNLMILAGIIYVGGSLGMEMIGGYFYQQEGEENMTNVLLTTLEEGMEMAGIAIFTYALNLYKKEFQV